MLGATHRAFVLIAISAVVAVTLVQLGSSPLIDPDEPRYAQSAREMLQRGDLLVPYLNGEARLNKPPLFYWLDAVSMRLFGTNEFAARLPSALAAIAAAALAAVFAGGLYGASAGFLALPIFLSTPLVAGVGRIATTDMTMTAFLCAAFVLWWKARAATARLRFVTAAWAVLGLAVMTKGPVALALFVLTVVAYCSLRREWELLRSSFHPAALGVFLIVTLPWPAVVAAAQRDAWSMWYRETFERFSVGVDHSGSFLLPLGVIVGGTLPWWLLSAPEGRGLRSQFRALVARDDELFLAVWVLVVLVFFTVCRTRMPHYVLPACFPMAVLAAKRFSGAVGGDSDSARFIARVQTGIAVLAGAAAVYGLSTDRVAVKDVLVWGVVTGLALAYVSVLVRRHMIGAAVAFVACGVCAGAALVAPAVMKEVALTRSMAAPVAHWRVVLDQAQDVYFHGNLSSRMSLVYYLGKPVKRPSSIEEVDAALASASRTAVLEVGSTLTCSSDSRRSGSQPALTVERYTVAHKTYIVTLNYVPTPRAD